MLCVVPCHPSEMLLAPCLQATLGAITAESVIGCELSDQSLRRTETVAVSGTEGGTEGEGRGRYPGMCPHSSSSVYVVLQSHESSLSELSAVGLVAAHQQVDYAPLQESLLVGESAGPAQRTV